MSKIISLSTIAATPVVPFFAKSISSSLGETRLYKILCSSSLIYFTSSQLIFPVVTFFDERNMYPDSEYFGVW